MHMTDTLLAALKAWTWGAPASGSGTSMEPPMTDNETKYHCYRICRVAGLPERVWHNLRHAFGTHAAMFGGNPWKLLLWMGHKRIDETMLYVNFAQAHLQPLPEVIVQASRGHDDPTTTPTDEWPRCSALAVSFRAAATWQQRRTP